MRRTFLATRVLSLLILLLMGTAVVEPAMSTNPLQSGRPAATASRRTYDEVTDTTFITLKGFPLANETGQSTGLTLRVFASFPGDVPREPVISLGWISASSNWQYSGTENMTLTVNGSRQIKIGQLRHEWMTTMEGAVFEQFWAETSLDVLKDLGRATRVHGTLGNSAFALTAEQLGALGALAAELSPKSY